MVEKFLLKNFFPRVYDKSAFKFDLQTVYITNVGRDFAFYPNFNGYTSSFSPLTNIFFFWNFLVFLGFA